MKKILISLLNLQKRGLQKQKVDFSKEIRGLPEHKTTRESSCFFFLPLLIKSKASFDKNEPLIIMHGRVNAVKRAAVHIQNKRT